MNEYTNEMYTHDLRIAKSFLYKKAKEYLTSADVIQTCVIRLWLARTKYKSNCRYPTYAYQVLSNQLKDIFKIKNKRKRYITMISLNDLITPEIELGDTLADEHDMVEETLNNDLVKFVFKRMNNPYIKTIVDRISGGLTHEEIAKELGITRRRVSQIFQEFTAIFKEEYHK